MCYICGMAGASDYVPAVFVLALGLGWAGALTAWPRDGQPVAAIYGPGRAAGAFAGTVNAGADAVLGFGGWPGVVVARSDRPDFIENLYDSGALVVVRAPAAAECVR